ncbi:MAG: hypothetical protein K6V36_16280, partial [Anaerolineae bacterium]|nr:hypothetical protein [Anaerolineae bacterium]
MAAPLESAPLAEEGGGPTVTVEAEGGAMVYVCGDFEPGRERLDSTGALRFAVGSHAYAADYDANGNMTSRVLHGRGQVLTWDAENRLIS